MNILVNDATHVLLIGIVDLFTYSRKGFIKHIDCSDVLVHMNSLLE